MRQHVCILSSNDTSICTGSTTGFKGTGNKTQVCGGYTVSGGDWTFYDSVYKSIAKKIFHNHHHF